MGHTKKKKKKKKKESNIIKGKIQHDKTIAAATTNYRDYRVAKKGEREGES
jgi:hypothetical protein